MGFEALYKDGKAFVELTKDELEIIMIALEEVIDNMNEVDGEEAYGKNCVRDTNALIERVEAILEGFQ